MKTFLSLLAVPSLALAQASDHAAWRHVQSVDVPAKGLIRLTLPSATINASKPGLDDLRLVDTNGAEVPYIVEQPTLPSMQIASALNFRASLVGVTTSLEFDTGTTEKLHQITLISPSSSFIKAARLEGSNDGTTWQPLVDNDVLFRQGNVDHLRFDFAPATWQKLRVTINDERSAPVAFTGAQLGLYQSATQTLTETATITARSESKGETLLTLKLPTGKSWLGVLRVKTPEPIFSRHARVSGSGLGEANGGLLRIALEGHQAEVLDLHLQRQITDDELTLSIENGDSPPLKIDSVEITRYPQTLLFYASGIAKWKLFTGNSAAEAPRYDLAMLRSQLQSSASVTAIAGPLQTSDKFKQDANAPDETGAGAAIDLSGWSKRKTIEFKDTGVIQIELDQEVLATASSDYRDLRVIQGGAQVPFLIEPSAETTTISVPIEIDPNPKLPNTSRWLITLPATRLPVQGLTAQSPTPLFNRNISLRTPVEWHGEKRDDFLSSAQWQHKPGSTEPLVFGAHFRVDSDKLVLTTENGDNAAISIDSVTVSLPIVRLLFKADSKDSAQLYFGNPKARQPQYDLDLIRYDLTAANKVIAKLSPAELLKPEAKKREAYGAGSPWLWAALVIVMGALLWMVARLLPKPPTES